MPRARWSSTRPGVPTMICAPLRVFRSARGSACRHRRRRNERGGRRTSLTISSLHLHGQLARRHHDQRLRMVNVLLELRAFPGSESRTTAVLPVPVRAWPTTSISFERKRNQPGLNRRGIFVAGLLQGVEHDVREAEAFKSGLGGRGLASGQNESRTRVAGRSPATAGCMIKLLS